MIKSQYKFIELQLRHPFAIAKFTRTTTPVLLLKLSLNGLDGYGEASMVPYMGESPATAQAFLEKIDWAKIKFPFDFETVIACLDDLAPGNTAVKAAIDIALNDLAGKIEGKPCWEIYGTSPSAMPVTSYTIGIDTPAVIAEKVALSEDFKVIKLKLGRDNDMEIVQTVRKLTSKPLYIDANQGWNDRIKAIDLIYWLHDQGAIFIEQPMDKTDVEGNAWLAQRSPIPIIADEAVQRFSDIDKIKGAYHGINVKLMKCGGMFEAYKMITKAKQLGMRTMIGCMSETSCATLAGASLAPLCNWSDLDGPWLTTNNPFENPLMENGRYILDNTPGLGLKGGNDIFSSVTD